MCITECVTCKSFKLIYCIHKNKENINEKSDKEDLGLLRSSNPASDKNRTILLSTSLFRSGSSDCYQMKRKCYSGKYGPLPTFFCYPSENNLVFSLKGTFSHFKQFSMFTKYGIMSLENHCILSVFTFQTAPQHFGDLGLYMKCIAKDLSPCLTPNLPNVLIAFYLTVLPSQTYLPVFCQSKQVILE